MKIKINSITLILAFLLPFFIGAQNFSLSNNSSIIVSGTSSLHDWDVQAESFTGAIIFDDVNKGMIKDINISVIAESLKSGKRGMDKNTYKALKTDTHKSIRYHLVDVVSIEKIDATTFKVQCNGELTIAGTTKTALIDFLLTTKDNTCSVTGSCSVKMTSFGVEPPKALLGTIKTGDEVTIKFNTSFVQD